MTSRLWTWKRANLFFTVYVIIVGRYNSVYSCLGRGFDDSTPWTADWAVPVPPRARWPRWPPFPFGRPTAAPYSALRPPPALTNSPSSMKTTPRLNRPEGSACSCRRLAANQRLRIHPLGRRPQFSVPSPLGRVSGLLPLAEGRRRNTAAAAVWAASPPCRFSAHFRWAGSRRCLESDQQRQHSGDRRRSLQG